MAQVESVSSWYDSGVRLDTTEGLSGVVVNTKKPAAMVQGDAKLLQRYMQLHTVIAGATPLPQVAVEALISKVEDSASSSFEEATILGEWQLVWQRNAKQATRSQKALSPLPQYSNFITDETGKKIFRNIVQVSKQRCRVIADVAYTLPESEAPIRLGSTICAASLEIAVGRRFGWKPLRIPLPLNGVGWLDVTYLSADMRVTRGNRGGVFVHMRDSILTREAAEATRAAVPY